MNLFVELQRRNVLRAGVTALLMLAWSCWRATSGAMSRAAYAASVTIHGVHGMIMQRMRCLLVLVCVLVAGGAFAQSTSLPAEQAIRPLMAKMFAAANAHDTDAFMASYLRSPGFIFVMNGEVIHGWDALHAQQLKWWHNGKSDARYTQSGEPGFMPLGPGVEVVTWPLAAHRTLPDGKISEYAFVVSYVWQKLPQGWRIVYGHESWAKPPG